MIIAQEIGESAKERIKRYTMYSPQSDKNTIDEDKAQLMTKQLLVELGLDIDSYSISNRYVLKNILFRFIAIQYLLVKNYYTKLKLHRIIIFLFKKLVFYLEYINYKFNVKSIYFVHKIKYNLLGLIWNSFNFISYSNLVKHLIGA